MANIGNPFTPVEKKAVLCGSGELGKEIAIELERYGVHVVAVDKYANAPAMQVAQSSHVLSMLDGDALAKMIEEENPDLVIPGGRGHRYPEADRTRKERLHCNSYCKSNLPDDEQGGHQTSCGRGTWNSNLKV